MLLTGILFLVQAKQATGPVQTWEKVIAPGVTYRMQVRPEGPFLVNAVRVSTRAKGVLMTGELAQGGVFEPEGEHLGRTTLSDTMKRTRALVGINADYFPFTGDPLGAMVKDNELISRPFPGRAVLCWGDGFIKTAYLGFAGSVRFANGIQSLGGLNEECLNDMVVLNTPTARYATASDVADHVVLEMSEKISPTGSWKFKVKRLVTDKKWIKLEENEGSLTYRGKPGDRMNYLRPGDEVTVNIDCTGADWKKTKEVVAGGPLLVANGKKYVPYKEEGFTEGFATKRHPRTAIGKANNGDVWFVTIDGRQGVSEGMTLDELAGLMLEFGCVEAINMDGGGSATLSVRSLVVNRPSGGAERQIANALLVYHLFDVPQVAAAEVSPVIAGPAELTSSGSAVYRVVDETGAEVPTNEVIWSATGAAWVDQSGTLRGNAEGACILMALVRGASIQLTIQVKKP